MLFISCCHYLYFGLRRYTIISKFLFHSLVLGGFSCRPLQLRLLKLLLLFEDYLSRLGEASSRGLKLLLMLLVQVLFYIILLLKIFNQHCDLVSEVSGHCRLLMRNYALRVIFVCLGGVRGLFVFLGKGWLFGLRSLLGYLAVSYLCRCQCGIGGVGALGVGNRWYLCGSSLGRRRLSVAGKILRRVQFYTRGAGVASSAHSVGPTSSM